MEKLIITAAICGTVGINSQERSQPVESSPEMATLDCGILNFVGDEIFINTENMIIEFSTKMKEYQVKPELECFDKSMLEMALRLSKKGYITEPLHSKSLLSLHMRLSVKQRKRHLLY
ncbi:MAG: 3-keto-5-aminohexanoate cleavage protein [Brevinema sp.]